MNIRIAIAALVTAAALHGGAQAQDAASDAPARLISKMVPNLAQPLGRETGDSLIRDARVTVAFDIDEVGHVYGAQVVESQHANGKLNAAALKIVGTWVYEPARHDGRAVVVHDAQAVVVFRAD